MKIKRWAITVVGIALAGSLFAVSNSEAQGENGGIPDQINVLNSLVTQLQQTVTAQQNEIASLKDTVSKQTVNDAQKSTLTVQVRELTPGFDNGVTVVPPKYTPITGGKVTVMDTQGKEYSGTIDSDGKCSFTLPVGIYSVRLVDSTGYFGDDWKLTTVSLEKPAVVNYEFDNV